MLHIDDKQQLWLSQRWLVQNGILESSLNNWSVRNTVERKHLANRAFINYDSIPAPSRKKLPPKDALILEAQSKQLNQRAQYFYDEMFAASTSETVYRWKKSIDANYPKLSAAHKTEFAKRASVFERINQIYFGETGDLDCLFKAYNTLYPNAYSLRNRFVMAISKSRKEGVLSVAVDKRVIRIFEPVHDELTQYWAMYVLDHNKGYSQVMAYSIFAEACRKEGVKTPKIDWFRKYYQANKNIIDANRLGTSAFEKKNQNYAKIISALYSGDQWQIDGWRIPIYCKKRNNKGGIEYFATYTLFAVLDAHSRKIIGYHIAESENTETILNGLEMAVKHTQTLPFEIVADNHSFNKTKEADNLKLATDTLGVTWTVDSNPRRKAILERAFKTLGEKHFKRHYGYIGQGIKTKEEIGRTQQELMDIYTKPDNFLTFDQLKAVVICAIDEYNSNIISKLKDTPNNLYKQSEQPNAIAIDDFTRLQLFIRASEHTIRHGQITIRRGSHMYEYQLPASISQQYNNTLVLVRYSDFEKIYLFDKHTDAPIGEVQQKFAIHGALANQTAQDIEYLNKNKGRIKGINTQAKRKKQSLFDAASTINPNAYEVINKITTSKDAVQELQQNYNLRQMALEHDVIPENISPLPQIDEMLDSDLKPRKQAIKSPFAKTKGSMEIITIEA